MKELKRLLKPLKNKIIVNNVIYRLLQTVSVGLAVDLIILVFSKFLYVPAKTYMCIGILLVSVVIGLILALVKYKVTDYNAAEEGDRLGCDERLITAYGILATGGEKNDMEKLAVSDAVKAAKSKNLAGMYKITFPKRLAVIAAIILAASCLTGFAPDAGVYQLTPVTEQALKEAEEINKALQDDEELSDSLKEEYNKIIKDLNKELKKAKDSKEAKKLINEVQKELKKLENKASEDKNNIKNMLSDYSAGNDISSAMDANNSEALSQAMQKLAEELAQMTDEELEELAEQLSELADEMSDEELKKLLEEAAEAAKNGDTKSAAEALSKAASSSLSKSSAASSATGRLASSLAKASDGTGKTATSTSNSNGSSTSKNGESSSGENGEGNGSGEGDGSGNGSGSGEGNGNGNGNGNGSGGSGSGTGGNGRGFGHTETEKVYTRTAEGLEDKEEQLQSVQTDEGEITYSQTQTSGVSGESVPYDTVVTEYKEQAMKETENSNIPYGMREIIAEYFSGLEK